MSGEVVLNVQGLNVHFRQDGALIHAVRDVSFDLRRGETVALVGESGSGKSVTALSTVSLLGDSAEISGSITYEGAEMVGADEAELRRVRGNDISFIFQEPMTSLNPLHTIIRACAAIQHACGSSSFLNRSAFQTQSYGLGPIRTNCPVGSVNV
jgi:microcin C transport system ATP-binding protein